MCSIDAHEKDHQSSCDNVRRGVVCPLLSNSTTEAFVFLDATIDFIDFWLKALKHNFIERYNMYACNTKTMFQKISVGISKQPIPR